MGISTIIVIGNDPNLRGRIESASHRRRHAGIGVQVEYLELTDIASLARKRPQAIVIDVRSSNATTIDVISRLKMRARQPSLILQVTPRQKQDAAWTHILPASRTVLITPQTSKREVQGLLDSLLGSPRSHQSAAPPLAQDPETVWRRQNDRRIDLILKERDSALTTSEKKELAQLQQEASRQVNRGSALDFDALAGFNAQARKIAARG